MTFLVCYINLYENSCLPLLSPGEGSGGEDLHQVADAPSEDKASRCTVFTHII